ncbi:MAG: hypothetical protein CMP39_00325 [Rickettsiales bacterium]|nr:hypothetical protein [Rickettsiales bacterium]|tara:strand:+ start:19967 stop:20548 length:582 start_codon:yes stop_codon:yes gene_type:complete
MYKSPVSQSAVLLNPHVIPKSSSQKKPSDSLQNLTGPYSSNYSKDIRCDMSTCSNTFEMPNLKKTVSQQNGCSKNTCDTPVIKEVKSKPGSPQNGCSKSTCVKPVIEQVKIKPGSPQNGCSKNTCYTPVTEEVKIDHTTSDLLTASENPFGATHFIYATAKENAGANSGQSATTAASAQDVVVKSDTPCCVVS